MAPVNTTFIEPPQLKSLRTENLATVQLVDAATLRGGRIGADDARCLSEAKDGCVQGPPRTTTALPAQVIKSSGKAMADIFSVAESSADVVVGKLTSQCHIPSVGTYFLLYDFIDFFEKDGPSFLQREKYHEIIDRIFKNMSRLERDAIIFQYTNWEQVHDGYLNQKMIGDVVGDYFFICPTNDFAELAAERGMKVYYYYFTHRTSTSLWGEWMGVMHGDEIEYVFGHPLNLSLQFNSRERELSLKIMQVFTRFAGTGKPVTDDVNWPLYTKDQPQYFIFNADKNGIGRGPRATACAFWNDFLPKLRDNSGSAEAPCVNTYISNMASTSERKLSSTHHLILLLLMWIFAQLGAL